MICLGFTCLPAGILGFRIFDYVHYLSAQKKKKEEDPRIFEEDEKQGREKDLGKKEKKGKAEDIGLMPYAGQRKSFEKRQRY